MSVQNAIANAARIAFEMDGAKVAHLQFHVVDEVEAAAIALGELEDHGLDWETQPLDWESACARIAKHILDGARQVNWKAWLTAEGIKLPDKLPRIFVALNADRECHVFVPKGLAVDVTILDRTDPAPHAYYQSHGAEHPEETHERLMEDDSYRRFDQ